MTTANHTITPTLIDGEPKIRDLDLGERLGFSQPRDIRKIIARHHGALSQMGEISEIGEVSGRGQRAKAYYLNRKQAIFITVKSETEAATDITIEIIERFEAFERGIGEVIPPRAEPTLRAKPHDEWTQEELRTKISEAHLYRQTMSTAAAVWLMRREGFPMPPDALLPTWQRQDAGLFGKALTVNILNNGQPD